MLWSLGFDDGDFLQQLLILGGQLCLANVAHLCTVLSNNGLQLWIIELWYAGWIKDNGWPRHATDIVEPLLSVWRYGVHFVQSGIVDSLF